MFYRVGGAPQRLSRWEDEVFVDQAGMSTAWLPCVAGAVASVDACKAYLNQPTNLNVTRLVIRKTREWQTAVFVLESKRGSECDEEARCLGTWDDQLVGERVVISSPGWVRLRLISFVPLFTSDGGLNTISTGVDFRLFITRGTDTSLKVAS